MQRVFHDNYMVVAGPRVEIDRCLDCHGLREVSYSVAQRVDAGLEMLTLATRRDKQARRPMYAGQDIAMRSWEKIYRLLAAAACKRFGARNVAVIRIMVDCLTLHMQHPFGTDVTAELIATGATGDGETPQEEYASERIAMWYQLNKAGYEVHYFTAAARSSAGWAACPRLTATPRHPTA